MKEPLWLTIDAVLSFHGLLVHEHGGTYQIRDRSLLESALAAPRNKFAFGERDIFNLAAAYANAITRNHPFTDGNKRTAFVAVYTFLGINGCELKASEIEVVDFVEGLSSRAISATKFAEWLRKRYPAPKKLIKTQRTN